jgi:argininosuccinate synthase
MHACAVAPTAASTVAAKTFTSKAPRRAIVKPAPRSTVAARGVGPSGEVKKVVLAYSGGLDTSIILKWLQDTYGCEVVTFTADLGQGEELEPARAKAAQFGVKEIFVDDLREEFVRDYVFPMFRANALYEGTYLLGTSIARPLIAKRQIEIAKQVGADAVCHGATGKGNDQIRFELGYYGLKPDVKGDRAVERMGFELAHQVVGVRRRRGDPGGAIEAPRRAVLHRCELVAHFV